MGGMDATGCGPDRAEKSSFPVKPLASDWKATASSISHTFEEVRERGRKTALIFLRIPSFWVIDHIIHKLRDRH
jgi:hypothetical protein